MKTKLIISSPEVRSRAIEIIKNIPMDVIHEIVIREYKKDRSAEQNQIYWLWLTVIGDAMGESKEATHELMKGKFLCNIYERDNPDYAEMMQSLRAVYREGMRDESLGLHKKIIALTSTTTATVSQMQEYLTSIDHHAQSFGIRLPYPED